MRSLKTVTKTLKLSQRNFAVLTACDEFAHVHCHNSTRIEPVFNESVSKNGVKVISKNSDSDAASIQFTVLAGSSCETQAEKGVAHALSRTLFSAGSSLRSGIRLTRDIDNLGAKINASVDREKITYEITSRKEDINSAFTAVAELISKGTEDPFHFEDAFELIESAYEQTTCKISQYIHEAAYGEGTPLGSPILAYSTASISPPDLLQYRNAHFNASNLVVTGSGVAHDALVALVEKQLSVPRGSSSAPAPTPYRGGEMRVRTDATETTLAVAFPVPTGGNHTKNNAVLVAALSERLCSNDVSVFVKDGLLGFYIRGAPAATHQHLAQALQALKDLAAPTSNVDATKTRLSLDGSLALDSLSSHDLLLQTSFSGQPLASAADYSSVTSTTVQTTAKAALSAAPSLAAFGATIGAPTLASLKTLL